MNKLFTLILFSFVSFGMFGQPAGWISFTKESTTGIDDKKVFSSLINSEGDYWFGTNEGLVEYNVSLGAFKHYGSGDGLLGDRVYDMVEDVNGNVWVGTSGGVLKRVLINGVWYDSDVSAGLPGTFVRDLNLSSTGKVWCATYGGGVGYKSASGWVSFNESDGLVSDFCYSIYAQDENDFWVGTNDGLSHYLSGVWTTYDISNGLPSDNVLDVLEDANGDIWVATTNGLGQFDGTNWTIHNSSNGVPDDFVYALHIDSQGDLWIGTAGGAAKHSSGSWQVYNIQNLLSGNEVFSITSKDSTMIFSLEDQGADVVIGNAVENYKYRTGLPYNYFKNIAEAPNGHIWFSSSSSYNELVEYDHGNWIIHNMPSSYFSIYDMMFDDGGKLWVASGNGLVYTYDGSVWEQISLPNTTSNYKLFKGGNGDVYVGCRGGVSHYDGVSWSFYSVSDQYENVMGFYEDDIGRLWALSYEGLYLLRNSKLDRIWARIDNSSNRCLFSPTGHDLVVSGYTDNYVHSVFLGGESHNISWPYNIRFSDQSPDGCTLMAAYDGLFVYNGNEITHIGTSGGYEYDLLVDASGRAWCVGYFGIITGEIGCEFEGEMHHPISGGWDVIPQYPDQYSASEEPPYWVSEVYPNPVENTINLDFSLPSSGTCTIQVLGMKGQLLKTKTFQTEENFQTTQMDVSDLPSGYYIISFWLDGELTTWKKFTIVHT